MQTLFSDPEVISAIISAIGTIISALLATVVIGHKIAKRKELQENLTEAIRDIEFLLRVEQLHCEDNKIMHNSSNKLKVRRQVRELYTANWSGKFTPSRAKRYIKN